MTPKLSFYEFALSGHACCAFGVCVLSVQNCDLACVIKCKELTIHYFVAFCESLVVLNDLRKFYGIDGEQVII